MKLYTGIDLHSNNNYMGIMDHRGRKVFSRKNTNDSEAVLEALAPYQDAMEGVVVESTFNWYWLVDLLMEPGY
ncbi:hypothetical protein SAMN02745216_05021, partial [Desulfatibacillum alkenivorans DSM 16219]